MRERNIRSEDRALSKLIFGGLALIMAIGWLCCYPRPVGTLPKYVIGKGVWTHRLEQCEGGDIDKMIKRAKENGLDYITLKVADGREYRNKTSFWGSNEPAKWTVQSPLVEAFHQAGIKVYAWGFNYLRHPEIEADRAIEALKLGADGYIFDVEEQSRYRATMAEKLSSKVRAWVDRHCPEKILVCSTYCRIDRQPGLPLDRFGKYCDLFMPQAYHQTFGWSPEQTINQMCLVWMRQERAWSKAGKSDSIKPIIPTGQAHVSIPAIEITQFANAAQGYAGVNFWLWDTMGQKQWHAVRRVGGKNSKKTLKLTQWQYPEKYIVRLARSLMWIVVVLVGLVSIVGGVWTALEQSRLNQLNLKLSGLALVASLASALVIGLVITPIGIVMAMIDRD